MKQYSIGDKVSWKPSKNNRHGGHTAVVTDLWVESRKSTTVTLTCECGKIWDFKTNAAELESEQEPDD